MAKSPLPWSLKGVSRAAREAAKAAAKREGVPLGIWLSRVIHEVSAKEGADTDTAGGSETRDESGLNSIERAAARIGLQAAGSQSQ